jgi:hypothetical protein
MDVGVLEGCSAAELTDGIDQLHAVMSATHAQLLCLVADYDRREAEVRERLGELGPMGARTRQPSASSASWSSGPQ